MTSGAGAADARPIVSAGPRFRHDPLVLRGPRPEPDLADGSPAVGRLGIHYGDFLIRLAGVDEEPGQALVRALGLVGGRAHADERFDDVLVIAATSQQLEALRAQLLTAPSAQMRLVEESIAAVRAFLRRDFEWACAGTTIPIADRPLIMGVVNCTPDSFYAGSRNDTEQAVARGVEMAGQGADLLDLGGESTRPGSDPVDAAAEIDRVVPVIEALRERVQVPLSVDTTKPAVADAAVRAGAAIINDISGLRYAPELAEVAAEHGAGLVLMHMRGTSADMYGEAEYVDVVAAVAAELRGSVERALAAGVAPESVVVDPGIGFAKKATHSLIALRHTAAFRSLGYPVLVGPSRKSFIGAVLDLPAEERLEGTAAAVAAAVFGGAQILRVHDVQEMRRTADMAAAIRDEGVGWMR